jgi:NAD(P)-dependent dehydrogenase (short-subunit alcohol dehydrogenase family)
MNLQLENKLASGSTAGTGFAIAKALAAEGARITVNGRTEASLPVSATVMKMRFKEFDEALKQLEEQMKKE